MYVAGLGVAPRYVANQPQHHREQQFLLLSTLFYEPAHLYGTATGQLVDTGVEPAKLMSPRSTEEEKREEMESMKVDIYIRIF